MLPCSNHTTDFANHIARLARDCRHAGQRPQKLFELTHYADTTVHLFTSAALALEFARVLKLDLDARPIAASELAAHAGVWIKRGLETFVLDRCARCTAANCVPIEMLQSEGQFGQFWAFTLILQEARMRHFAVSAFRSLLDKQVDEIVPKLKDLRDHVNAGCPAVHYALALLAAAELPDQQTELRAVSKERLVELGRADLADGIPDGAVGLLRGFAVLRQMAEGQFDAAASAGTRLKVGMAISQKRR